MFWVVNEGDAHEGGSDRGGRSHLPGGASPTRQYARTYLKWSGSSLEKKTADVWRHYHWFPRQMTSEKRAQKFHTDDATLPISG